MQQLKNISWWHEQLADWMLLNPHRPFKDAAAVFHVSLNYLYLLKNSDTFKAYWQERRRAREASLNEGAPAMLGSLQDKLQVMADMALDQQIELLERNDRAMSGGAASLISLEELRASSNQALKNLGYGLPLPQNAPINSGKIVNNNTVVNITADTLAAAREKMKQINATIAVEVPQLEAESFEERREVGEDE